MTTAVTVIQPTATVTRVVDGDVTRVNVAFTEGTIARVGFTGERVAGTVFNPGDAMALNGSDLDWVPHSDGSLVIDPGENVPRGAARVGVISDVQHGTRSGGTLHAVATPAVSGFMSAADKLKLDNSGELTNTAPVDVTKAAAAVGVSTEAARADHKHDIDTAVAVTLNAGASNAEGTSTSLARADHVHQIPTAAPVDVGTGNAEGTSTSFARADHVHDHANQPGGTLHAVATGALAGFMSAADKTKLDALITNTVPDTRTLTAGIGLTGGGDLTADRTFDVVGFRETSGPTDLLFAGIADGFVLARSGTDVIGIDPSTFGTGDVVGPAGATDNALVRFDTTTGKLIQDSAAILDDSGNLSGLGNITLSGTVDGRDVDADGTTLDNHVANTNNPHATDVGNLGSGTLAELNTAITDATLITDAPSDGTPYARQDAGWVSGGGVVTSLALTGLLNTILNLNQTVGTSPLTVDLAPVVNLVSLQTAYSNGDTILVDNVPTPVTFQASVAGEVFRVEDVAGNGIFTVSADNDLAQLNGGLTINDTFTNSAQTQNLILSDTFTTGGGYLGGGILSNGTVTYNNSFFIWALLQESKVYLAAAGPGFAAFTLFNALPVIRNSGNFNLVQALVLNCGVVHDRSTSGTSTTAQTTGLSFAAQARASASGATMTYTTGMQAVRFAPVYSTVSGSTVNFGTLVGLDCINPAQGLFQPGAGVETMTAYYGVRVAAIPFGGNVTKAALVSSITPATNARFVRNDGGADSDFGGGDLLDCGAIFIEADNTSISFGLADDVGINWNGSALEFDPLSGDDLRFTFGAGIIELDSATPTDLVLNFPQFKFGGTGTVGNQVGVFEAPARTVSVAGGWSDFLLTQAGNLDINGLAMSDVSAWVINSISLDPLGGGSISDIATLRVGGMTTSLIATNITSALNVTGRSVFRGSVNLAPTTPAELTADADDYQGQLSGNSQRSVVRVSSDASRTISGFDKAISRDNDTIWVVNVGANDVVLGHEDAGSAAANRIISNTGANLTLNPDESALLWYDDTDTRWRVLFTTGA